MKKKSAKKANDINRIKASSLEVANYDDILNGVIELLESARRTSARATNAIMTATYWKLVGELSNASKVVKIGRNMALDSSIGFRKICRQGLREDLVFQI